MNARFLFTVGILLTLSGNAGCGARQASEGGEETLPEPDLPAEQPDLPLECEAPLVDCDGVCVDLQGDAEHCGECGNECRVIEGGLAPAGGCEAGVCLPSWVSCANPYTTATCGEICDAPGLTRACVDDDEGCGGATMLWSVTWGDFGFQCTEESLVAEFNIPQTVACDMPISDAFELTGEENPLPEAGYWKASCCCVETP